jgi:O-acetyl-ADP-ribose deacetylase
MRFLSGISELRDMDRRIEIVQGDITKVAVDAIVNAANSSLMGGGGVDGAIHRAGGPEILEECKKIVAKQGGCKTGEAVITTAGRLTAKFVIHTVGPIWNGGRNKERELLHNCYKNSLKLAVEHQCRTIAFPNISTGVYHFPKKEAAEISIKATSDFLAKEQAIEKVVLVCFDEENLHLLQTILESTSI